mmetsp:Transcript_25573/g.37809  ORF Transcript_25573/g.37809 Transcript_25573/m.37809 type:complete len:125 (+) Transcript_25573:82-456(+)|eukprot:CAMPEP_0194081360 /NCGR_PEP_ID=MMETSP0149-20130528/7161_1 /TAXON_ID=122233 /ORGANISM="Chaetoceros debilis, Strain MM31A-1" /LENGTH=124 /DNA_ID=CAMNT_0038763265 /DNA_START=66 /DNA_END=440 /DNA_ORIENTATION=-
MTASKTPPLHVLRGIIRHLRSTPTQKMPISRSSHVVGIEASSDQYQSPLIGHVILQYRAAQSASSSEVDQLRKMAYDFLSLKDDLAERARLHELDGGAEVKLSPKEMSRRAAARAGLQLPGVHE